MKFTARSIVFIAAVLFLIGLPLWAQTATLERIVDGDTIIVQLNHQRERVRLIGIDTPESTVNERARRVSRKYNEDLESMVAQGLRAKAFVVDLIRPGDELRLETDVRSRDDYQRILAYVYLHDGRMLNEILVSEGFAYPLTVPPNVRHAKRFTKLFGEARRSKRGLWGDEHSPK